MSPEDDEGDVVSDQEGRDPKRRYPVGRAHIDGGLVYRREGDGQKQVQRSKMLNTQTKGRPILVSLTTAGMDAKARRAAIRSPTAAG